MEFTAEEKLMILMSLEATIEGIHEFLKDEIDDEDRKENE